MRPLLSVLFGGLALVSGCYADLLSTVTVNPGALCNALPQTVTGTTSASVTVCQGITGGGAASTSIDFAITSTGLASWNFNDAASPFAGANSSSLFDYQFVVTGGSGSGLLNLTFSEVSISGSNDPQASASATVMASLNGIQNSNVRVCANPPAMSGIVCMNPTVPISVPFVYGTPFELSVALNAVAGGGLGGANIFGGGALSYSLPAGATIMVTPEPSTGILLFAGVLVFLPWARRSGPRRKVA